MPDWLNVDLFQTLLLLAATGLAFATYRGEKDARADAAIERRLDQVSQRVAEYGEARCKEEFVTAAGVPLWVPWPILLFGRSYAGSPESDERL
jgi:hypothetical protein